MKNNSFLIRFFLKVITSFLWLLLLVISKKLEAQSLLWKVTGNDVPGPSYLYGTIHIKDPRVFEWRDSVFNRLNQCNAFAGEIDLKKENLLKASEYMILPDGQTLHDRFTPEEYLMIRDAVKACSGFDLAMLDKFKPASLVALCLLSNAPSGLPATIDEMLYQYAVDNGKRVTGIETLEEQAALIDKIPDSYVVEYFRNLHGQEEEFEKLIHCYRSADLNCLWELMQDQESGTLLNDELIRMRNYRMTERLLPLVRQQSIFIAIGSGHLPGDEGVIALLRKAGFMVEPERILP
jgi:hypothetical protein